MLINRIAGLHCQTSIIRSSYNTQVTFQVDYLVFNDKSSNGSGHLKNEEEDHKARERHHHAIIFSPSTTAAKESHEKNNNAHDQDHYWCNTKSRAKHIGVLDNFAHDNATTDNKQQAYQLQTSSIEFSEDYWIISNGLNSTINLRISL